MALIVLGVIIAVGSFFTLTTIIDMLTAVIVIVQAVAQVVALTVLRRRQPGLRPYRQWLPAAQSAQSGRAGWLAGSTSTSRPAGPIELSVAWVAAGVVAYLVWARITRAWPFGPKQVREEYLAAQP